MEEARKRELILNHVRAHPGTTIVDAAIVAGVTHPTATYHLTVMERAGLVESERYGNKRHYFQGRSFDAWERRLVALLRSQENARILRAVWARPWTYLAEVAENERVSRLTVAASSRRFAELGLVATTREGRTRTLTPNRDALYEKARELTKKLPEADPTRSLVEMLLRSL